MKLRWLNGANFWLIFTMLVIFLALYVTLFAGCSLFTVELPKIPDTSMLTDIMGPPFPESNGSLWNLLYGVIILAGSAYIKWRAARKGKSK